MIKGQGFRVKALGQRSLKFRVKALDQRSLKSPVQEVPPT